MCASTRLSFGLAVLVQANGVGLTRTPTAEPTLAAVAPLDDWAIRGRQGADFGYSLPDGLLVSVVHTPRLPYKLNHLMNDSGVR